jgi:hypothetical protein
MREEASERLQVGRDEDLHAVSEEGSVQVQQDGFQHDAPSSFR